MFPRNNLERAFLRRCGAAALRCCGAAADRRNMSGRRGNTATVKLFGISVLVDSSFPAELKTRPPRNAGHPGNPDLAPRLLGWPPPPPPSSNMSPPLTARVHRHGVTLNVSLGFQRH